MPATDKLNKGAHRSRQFTATVAGLLPAACSARVLSSILSIAYRTDFLFVASELDGISVTYNVLTPMPITNNTNKDILWRHGINSTFPSSYPQPGKLESQFDSESRSPSCVSFWPFGDGLEERYMYCIDSATNHEESTVPSSMQVSSLR